MTDSNSNPIIVDLADPHFATEVEQSALPVFLYFWGPRCGPCKGLEPLYKQLAETYHGQIKFVKVNADDNPELSRRFNVRALPTLLVFRDGELVENANGTRTKAYFSNVLDKYARTPTALKTAPSRHLRAFHGDAALKESIVRRLRSRIEAGHIVPADRNVAINDADHQRYSLMGALLDARDSLAIESVLGVPEMVGRLEECVHSLLGREGDEGSEVQWHLPSPYDAWPLQWWQAVTPGSDLQSLPSHFIAWLMRERSAEIYPYLFSDGARTVMESLATLHARAACGDAPQDEEWRMTRHAAGEFVRLESDANKEDRNAAPHLALACVEMLTWPAHELDDALTPALTVFLLHEATESAVRSVYSPEQWEARKAEGEALEKVFYAKIETVDWSGFTAPEDSNTFMLSLDEHKALRAYAERLHAHDAPIREKARLAYAERLHVGLMQALSDTLSSEA